MISILHRAKKADTNIWVYGTPIFQGFLVEIISDITNIKYVVEKNTMCKCIGLKDRNGEYIFEGDIIQISQRGPKKAIVEWDKEYLCWRFNYNIPSNKPKSILKYKPSIQASKAHLYKVVGNIFDNVELCGELLR